MVKRAKVYSEATVKKLATVLDRLINEPKGMQIKEVISHLKPKIEIALEAGYSLSEICKFLKEEQIFITPATLKECLKENQETAEG
jgi:hypothetical protein